MSSQSPSATIDVAAKQVADDPQIVELQSITTIYHSTELAKFDPIQARLDSLKALAAASVYDINTKDGEDTSRMLRGLCVKVRTDADKAYKIWNAPLLQAQRSVRLRVDGIEAEAKPLELRYDTEIKAKEKTREDARLAKIATEQARIRALRDKITSIAGFPTAAAKAGNASEIYALLGTLDGLTLDEATFEEFVEEAAALHTEVTAQLNDMLQSAQAREAQAAQLAAQALQLEVERQAQALAAKRASAMLAIRAYPLDAMGLSTGQILDFMLALVRPSEAEFGDELPAAESAFDSALLRIQGIYTEAKASEVAARVVLVAAAADAQRRMEDQAAAEQRQREATASAVLLKNQQDAFEEEKRIAAASIAAEKERLAEERKAIQAQADALANPPVAVVVKAADDESTMPATPISDALIRQAMAGGEPGYVDLSVAELFSQALIVVSEDTAREDLKAREILDNICYMGEPYLCGLDRLFNPGTHAALVRLHNTLKSEQLEEIPA